MRTETEIRKALVDIVRDAQTRKEDATGYLLEMQLAELLRWVLREPSTFDDKEGGE